MLAIPNRKGIIIANKRKTPKTTIKTLVQIDFIPIEYKNATTLIPIKDIIEPMADIQ